MPYYAVIYMVFGFETPFVAKKVTTKTVRWVLPPASLAEQSFASSTCRRMAVEFYMAVESEPGRQTTRVQPL